VVFLDILGIASLFFFGCPPGCDKVAVFALSILADLENDRTEATAAPTDRTKLLRIVRLLVNDVHLIEYFLCLFQADAVFPLDAQARLFCLSNSNRIARV
jgi:hypothetical protein